MWATRRTAHSSPAEKSHLSLFVSNENHVSTKARLYLAVKNTTCISWRPFAKTGGETDVGKSRRVWGKAGSPAPPFSLPEHDEDLAVGAPASTSFYLKNQIVLEGLRGAQCQRSLETTFLKLKNISESS